MDNKRIFSKTYDEMADIELVKLHHAIVSLTQSLNYINQRIGYLDKWRNEIERKIKENRIDYDVLKELNYLRIDVNIIDSYALDIYDKLIDEFGVNYHIDKIERWINEKV